MSCVSSRVKVWLAHPHLIWRRERKREPKGGENPNRENFKRLLDFGSFLELLELEEVEDKSNKSCKSD